MPILDKDYRKPGRQCKNGLTGLQSLRDAAALSVFISWLSAFLREYLESRGAERLSWRLMPILDKECSKPGRQRKNSLTGLQSRRDAGAPTAFISWRPAFLREYLDSRRAGRVESYQMGGHGRVMVRPRPGKEPFYESLGFAPARRMPHRYILNAYGAERLLQNALLNVSPSDQHPT